MGVCVSAEGAEGSTAAMEAELAAIDELADLEEDPQEIIDQRRQKIRQAFIAVIKRPCSKPPFDPADPMAHLRVVEPDPESGDEMEERDAPPEPLMPDMDLPENPKASPPPVSQDSDDDISVSSDDTDDDEDDEEDEEEEYVPAVPKDTQLDDIIELCGGKEVYEDIMEMKDDETAATILGRAGEHDSGYPWAMAHFVKVCKETERLREDDLLGEIDGGLEPLEPVPVDSDDESDEEEPGRHAPENNYIASILMLRTALSHLQRSNRRLRVNLSKDIAEMHFDEEGSGSSCIGIELALAPTQEAAVEKLKMVTSAGIQSMIDRVEERINHEILPEYYAAYEDVGNKEALAYPEEVYIIEQFYPPGEEIESDEDAQCQLDVVIHKAQDVLAMDSSLGGEGTSDCYIKATVGDETFITDVRKATTNPIWEKSMKFDVDPEERRHKSLILKMYDEDFGGDEFMGMVTLPLHDLEKDGPPISAWYELLDEPKSRDKKIDRGRVYISLRFGEPTAEGTRVSEDNLSAVALAQVESYRLCRIQLNYCATKIQALWRGVVARGGVGGLRAGKDAEKRAIEKRVIMIQRKWRDKRMWRIIMSFKKKMTSGGIFLKFGSNGKFKKRQVHVPGNMSKIFWRDVGEEEDGKSFIEVKDVKAILVGRYTKTFQKYDNKQAEEGKLVDEKTMRASFSIITHDRTLDLQCGGATKEEAEAMKNSWVDSFAFLLRDQLQPASFVLLAKRKVQFKKA
eukprot:TRINITY_DN1802_c0_g1_i3.p1 TRINITY_DN1802_c0_g1~~TRINITY_DN1802_c0_g1_i3.p1  ORF type:complete len:741 (+),score=243.11 TRINITY_DN1802_c0_g1_i3:229-2451(+)